MTDLPAPESAHDPYHPPQVEVLLQRATELVAQARPMPLSASSMINKDEVLEALEHARARLPEELRAARWLLKEREEYLAKVRREGDEILELARNRAERMVQRSEVVRAAEHRARQIMAKAQEEARKLQHEVDDYCDQKLAGFEAVLERTTRSVVEGRRKLTGPSMDDRRRAAEEEARREEQARLEAEAAFFDQDRP